MWLDNPGPENFLKPWKAHYIAKDPDVIFMNISFQGVLAVFCVGFSRTQDPHDDPRIAVRLLNSNDYVPHH